MVNIVPKDLGKVVKSMEEFYQDVGIGRTLVYFMAEWAGPCKMIYTAFNDSEEIDNFFKENQIKPLYVNTDNRSDICSKEIIRSIPTMIGYENNERIAKVIGAVPPIDLIRELENGYKL